MPGNNTDYHPEVAGVWNRRLYCDLGLQAQVQDLEGSIPRRT